MASLQEKYEDLCAALLSSGSVLVAYSGGIDSTLLLDVAHEVLGQRAVAATVRSAFFPERELADAVSFCSGKGIEHLIVEEDVLSDEAIAANPENRCYLCKHRIFTRLFALAGEHGLDAVVDGSNVDDARDFRPGARALAELGAKSPLAEAGFTKRDIRNLALERGIDIWDKPSLACLASRIAFGEQITEKKLEMVDRAEELLRSAGIEQVRVRLHGGIARIEVIPSELNIALGLMRSGLAEAMHDLGFTYVTLDLDGYRTGSMNPR